jgi:predicted kinase
LPGSGKSYIGKQLIEDTIRDNAAEHIISADDYFLKNGRYVYEASKISEAHQTAQRNFYSRASKGYSPLIIDNTNLQSWEMIPYVQAAIQYSYHIEIIEPVTPWKWIPHKLAQKNKHNVPMEKIKKMMDNYDRITTVKEFARNVLNADIVKEPKLRDIPKFRPKPALMQVSSESDLIDFSFDANKNRKVSTNEQQEPLSWQQFNTNFQKQSTSSNPFSWEKLKESSEDSDDWKPPPQIFEDKWDQPNDKEVTIREKEKTGSREDENKPQPQRNQRKNKKPSSSPPTELDLKPHRKNCPNENQGFAQLRELYPNINDSCLWDFFEKCKGDHEWCANMLCDENLTDQMETGDYLTCNCFGEPSIPRKPVENGSIKKQTPVKAKKAKSNTDELLAVKIAIEDNVKIGEFKPIKLTNFKIFKT